MTQQGWGAAPAAPPPVCVRHHDRPTYLSCTRCGRPSCPQCLRSAAVGQHCVECVAQASAAAPVARGLGGAPLPTTPSSPVVTYSLIALNVLLFAVTVAQAGSLMQNQRSEIFRAWALIPAGVADGEFVRILGSGFLHFGPVHLALNMYALFVVGRDCEAVLGRARYLSIYLVSLLGGSAAVMALQDGGATAGASGAVFGLMGAEAVILLKLRRSPSQVLVVIGINVVISITLPGISLWGHLGGLTAGALATAGLLYAPGATARTSRMIGWSAIAAVAVVSMLVIVARAVALAG